MKSWRKKELAILEVRELPQKSIWVKSSQFISVVELDTNQEMPRKCSVHVGGMNVDQNPEAPSMRICRALMLLTGSSS